MRSFRLAFMVALLFICTARADEAVDTFNSIYRDRINQVRRTSDRADDADLAEELMDASDTLKETPQLQLLAFRHAYELTMRWTDTQKSAARALKWLSVSGEDDRLGEYQEKLVQNYQRVYARARGTLKTRAGNEYVDVAVSLGDQMTKVEKYDLAFKRYADAVRMARLVKHQDLAVFHARLNWVKQKEKTQARVKELEKAVLDGPEVGRAKAALELVDLYAGELNKVKEAAEMARLMGGGSLACTVSPNAMWFRSWG